MAITLVESPGTGAPTIGNNDYTKQNAIITANEVPDLSFLTDWESTATAPALKQGVYIYHAGNTYIVDTADYTINGTLSAGKNYIELVISGSNLIATWTTSLTGYFYNAPYGGIYSGTNQLLPDVCYLDGVDYIRGRSFGMDYNFIHLANGNFLISQFDSGGADITTSGGNIDTGGGDTITTNLDVLGNLTPSLSPTDGFFTVTGSFLIPAGVYILQSSRSYVFETKVQIYSGGVWLDSMVAVDKDSSTTFYNFTGGIVFSDGINVRITSTASSANVYYLKF